MTTTPSPISTDPDDLVRLLRGASVAECTAIRQQLVAQLGEDPAWQLYHAALEEVSHEHNIDTARSELREVLAIAEVHLQRATKLLTELSDELFDVDYAEGTQTPDMRAFLDDATRAIRATAALNPGQG